MINYSKNDYQLALHVTCEWLKQDSPHYHNWEVKELENHILKIIRKARLEVIKEHKEISK